MDADHVTKITWVPRLDKGSPGMTNHRTGEVFLSKEALRGIPDDYLYIVLLHEEGHLVLNTIDEEEADAYAFKRYADMGFKLDDAEKALEYFLHGNTNRMHHVRIVDQMQRIKKYKQQHTN
jgi:hypothetical protein